jgi:hypothetical protein
MARRFAESDAKWDRRMAEQEARWDASFAESSKSRVQAPEKNAGQIEDWHASMEGVVDDLRLEVGKISKNWERAVVDNSTTMTGVLAPSPPAVARPSAGVTADLPHGHRVELITGEDGFGSVTTLLHPPVKGTYSTASQHQLCAGSKFHLPGAAHVKGDFTRVDGSGGEIRGRLPKLNFPTFDGENPKLWIKRSRDYFDMYAVEPQVWVRVSTMNFVGAAAWWLSSIEESSQLASWSIFCQALLERFGRDEHTVFIRQLFSIRQTSSVAEYVERFSQLRDNLVAYGRPMDPLYFVQRFVDGLRADIRAAVFVQCSSSFDTACVLASLQEEVSGPLKRLEGVRSSFSVVPKAPVWGPLPLPLPPKMDPMGGRTEEAQRGDPFRPRVIDDKLVALRAYRRARGLCQKCAEKVSKDHQCPPTVQLHALQEVWDLCQLDEEQLSVTMDVESPVDGQLCLAVSVAAIQGSPAVYTMKLQGTIQGQPVLILVDSGSSHSFVSSRVAARLSGVSEMQCPMMVQVADGGRLLCSRQLLGVTWSVQNCEFLSDFQVLDIAAYDQILGVDWLAQYSPMKVHWLQQWLLIPYRGSSILLQGCSVSSPQHTVVVKSGSKSLVVSVAGMGLPEPMETLLSEFSSVFDPPSGLPPSRDCDHAILLVAGASPVHVRPYRYPPLIKDEVERQIAVMLK